MQHVNHLSCKNTYPGIELLNIVEGFGIGKNRKQKTSSFPSSAFVLDTTVKQVTLTSLQDRNGCEMFRMLNART